MNFDPYAVLTDVMRSLGFLSRIPVPSSWFIGDDGKLSTTCRAFPIASAIMTLPAIIILIGSNILALPPLLAAVLSVSALIIVSGALHEDGMADVADGFFGSSDKDRRLAIMKDSRIGTYGALAIIISFSIRTIAIAAILQASVTGATLAIIAASAISRGALVWHWSQLESARKGGTADKVGAPTADALTFALISSVIIAVSCSIGAKGFIPTILALCCAVSASFAFRKLTKEKIGGHTGDSLGASAVIAEAAFLIGLASSL